MIDCDSAARALDRSSSPDPARGLRLRHEVALGLDPARASGQAVPDDERRVAEHLGERIAERAPSWSAASTLVSASWKAGGGSGRRRPRWQRPPPLRAARARARLRRSSDECGDASPESSAFGRKPRAQDAPRGRRSRPDRGSRRSTIAGTGRCPRRAVVADVETGHVGKLHVEEDDVRAELGDGGERGGAVGCLGHDLELARLEHRAGRRAEARMVVDDQTVRRTTGSWQTRGLPRGTDNRTVAGRCGRTYVLSILQFSQRGCNAPRNGASFSLNFKVRLAGGHDAVAARDSTTPFTGVRHGHGRSHRNSTEDRTASSARARGPAARAHAPATGARRRSTGSCAGTPASSA